MAGHCGCSDIKVRAWQTPPHPPASSSHLPRSFFRLFLPQLGKTARPKRLPCESAGLTALRAALRQAKCFLLIPPPPLRRPPSPAATWRPPPQGARGGSDAAGGAEPPFPSPSPALTAASRDGGQAGRSGASPAPGPPEAAPAPHTVPPPRPEAAPPRTAMAGGCFSLRAIAVRPPGSSGREEAFAVPLSSPFSSAAGIKYPS